MSYSPMVLTILATFMLVIFVNGVQASVSPDSAAQYQLAVSFEIEQKQLFGTAHIVITPGESFSLDLTALKITGILIKRQDGSSLEGAIPNEGYISIPAKAQARELFISYSRKVTPGENNLIEANGITLLNSWYPLPDKKMSYQLSATLPDGFTAITQSNFFPLKTSDGMASARFDAPLSAISFAAAPYELSSLQVREGLKVYTLFFPEDQNLAGGYLQAAGNYIRRYEKQIGPFPYNHYVIVANRLPTGLGMPTFTLLGQSVLQLPFIKDTSLGHEILHSWFGNSVDVDISLGNWCEGLTSHLADHAYRRDAGEGRDYRKESITNYLSYVSETNVIPLKDFISASHTQPLARARRAVGYSRSLLLFNELEHRIGKQHFDMGIQQLYQQFRGKTASWQDLSAVFSEVHGKDLGTFFTERIGRTDIPVVEAKGFSVDSRGGTSQVRFQLLQKNETPYSLMVPVRVVTGQEEHMFLQPVDQAEVEISLEVAGLPLSVTIDPDYTFLRKLAGDERPASWSQFMGGSSKLVVMATETERQKFEPLIAALEDEKWDVKYDSEVTNAELADGHLLFLGESSARNSLFADPAHSPQGFTLDVRANPLNDDYVAVLVSSSGENQTAAVARRLGHYGKYGFLQFNSGRIVDKRVPISEAGQVYLLEELPVGGATAPLNSFETIASELDKKDVIYVGENHNSLSDHRLQLRLIEAIHRNSGNIAIGMEMFPNSSQDALDSFVLEGEMSESEFLKESGYFKVWSYDYRYFREIFQFAKKHRIPVVGLNLPREIVSTVFRTGGTDALEKETRSGLPKGRDLSLDGYAEGLRAMHDVHRQGSHGSGKSSGFIQAQALWDETMAKNIAVHLQQNPGRKMIVLAGAQHTRKDYGIPPRVARRIDVDQASVLNILNGSSPVNLPSVADYFFLSEPLDLPESALIGVVLEEQTKGDISRLEITDFSPGSKARNAGIQQGDIILTINDHPVSTMEDIRISMYDARPGETATISVIRSGEEGEDTIELEVELVARQN